MSSFMGDEHALLPETKSQDVEDVVWGLQTAAALWGRGERLEALVWIRRAAEAAGAAGDDQRAVELAKHAVDLERLIAPPAPTEAAPVSAAQPSMVRRPTMPPPAKPPPPKKPPKPDLDHAETLDPDAAADLLGEEDTQAASSPSPRAPAATRPSSRSTGAFSALRPTGSASTAAIPAVSSGPASTGAPASGAPSVAAAPPAAPAAAAPAAPQPHPLASTQVSPRSVAAPPVAPRPASIAPPPASVAAPVAPAPPSAGPTSTPVPHAAPASQALPAAPVAQALPAAPVTQALPASPVVAALPASHVAPATALPDPAPAVPSPEPPTVTPPASAIEQAEPVIAEAAPPPGGSSRSASRARAARREPLASFIGLEPSDGATPRPAAMRKKRQPILDPWSDELPPSEPAPRTMAHRTETTSDESDVITSAPPLDTTLKRKPPPPPPKRTQTLSGTMLAVTGEIPAAPPDLLKLSATETPKPGAEAPRPPPTRKPTLIPRAAPPPDAAQPSERKSLPPPAQAEAPVAPPPAPAPPSVEEQVKSEPPPATMPAARTAERPPAPPRPPSAPPPPPAPPPPAPPPPAPPPPAPPPPATIDEEPTRDDTAPAAEMPVLFGDPSTSQVSVGAKAPSAPPPPPQAPPAPPTLVDAARPEASAQSPAPPPAEAPVVAPEAPAPEARAAAPATIPPEERMVGGLRLDRVEAFADVPADVQRLLSLAARVTDLGIDEEVNGFGAALVLTGGGAVCATIADAAAVALGPASLVPALTSITDVGAIRVVATEATRIATWEKAAFEELLKACPWVLDEIVRIGDRLASLAGATMGALGDLDDESRYAALARLATRSLAPHELLIPAGGELLGLTIVGAGAVAVDREKDGVEFSAGDIVLPESVMEGGVTEFAVKAGPEGALVLTATRHTTVELFSTMPSLLELLRLG
jgi:hypothetical protein